MEDLEDENIAIVAGVEVGVRKKVVGRNSVEAKDNIVDLEVAENAVG